MWDYVGVLCPESSHINMQNNSCTHIYILLSDVSYYCEQQHNHIQIQNRQAMMCEGYIMSVSQGTYIYAPWCQHIDRVVTKSVMYVLLAAYNRVVTRLCIP